MQNSNILAIDTSLDLCSVGFASNGIFKELTNQDLKIRSRDLITMLDNLLVDHKIDDFDVLAFGAGPGSWTGLKISSSVIQGLSLIYNKPIVKVSTLQALALFGYESTNQDIILSCIDAKMGEIYYGIYQFVHNQGINVAIQADSVIKLKDLNLLIHNIQMIHEDVNGTRSNIQIIGDGANILFDHLPKQIQSNSGIIQHKNSCIIQQILKIANYNYINYDYINNDPIPFYLRIYE